MHVPWVTGRPGVSNCGIGRAAVGCWAVQVELPCGWSVLGQDLFREPPIGFQFALKIPSGAKAQSILCPFRHG